MKKQRVAMSTVIGLFGGITCMAIAIAEAGDIRLFLNLPSFLMIMGGTTFSMIMSYPFSDLKTLGPVIKESFFLERHDPMEDIDIIVELSTLARREGLLSLEDHLNDSDNYFLKKGIKLLVDGTAREGLENSMLSEIYHTQRRHRTGASMVSMIANTAPALGLVGTYAGLIPMLVQLRDPDALGPLMAIELVSSFYGGFLANIIFTPMAKKLITKSAIEKNRNELLLEGILAIHDGKNPRLIQEDLLAYLTKKDASRVARTSQGSASEQYSDGKVVDYRRKGA